MKKLIIHRISLNTIKSRSELNLIKNEYFYLSCESINKKRILILSQDSCIRRPAELCFLVFFRIFERGFLSSRLLVFHPDGKLLCNDQNNLCNFRFLDLLPRSGLSGVFVKKLQNHEVQPYFLQEVLLLQSVKSNQQLSEYFAF